MATRFIGMDVHKQYTVVVGVDQMQQVVLASERVLTTALEGWSRTHLTQEDAVVVEVSTPTWAVLDVLRQYAGQVVAANPYKTKLIAEAQIKNDKVDALALAKLLASNFICQVWVPSSAAREWRGLARHRARLRQHTTQAKNRLQHLLQGHNLNCPSQGLFSTPGRAWLEQQVLSRSEQLIVRQLLAQVEFLEGQIAEVEHHMAYLASDDPRIARLLQISGVGLFTAFSILAVIGDIERFPTPSKLCGYVGLVPREHQSGGRGYRGHITKAGDRLLRWLIIEAAQAAVRCDPHWQQVHARIARRRGYSVAVVAVARKLLVTIWHMLTQQTNYQYLRSPSYVTKLQQWAYSIGHQRLPTPSTKDFVAMQLRALGLSQLADALVSVRRNAALALDMPVT